MTLYLENDVPFVKWNLGIQICNYEHQPGDRAYRERWNGMGLIPPESSAMLRFQYSLRWMLVLLGILLAGLSAMRGASFAAVRLIYLFTFMSLLAAVLGWLWTRGEKRSFWSGFALFSLGYLILSYAPWTESTFGRSLFVQELAFILHEDASDLTPNDRIFLEYENQWPAAQLNSVNGKDDFETSGISIHRGGGSFENLGGLVRRRGFRTEAEYRAVRVGHCIAAIMLGLLGGQLGAMFYRSEPRSAQRVTVESRISRPEL